MLDNETFESMKQELREEAKKRLEILKVFHEYGIFYTQRGLSVKEYMKNGGSFKSLPF